MLLEELFLEYFVVLFKSIQKIKINGSVSVVVPKLYQINSRITIKNWVVCIEPLLCFYNIVPISNVKIKISTWHN